jgi:hypothetical protein
MSSQPTPPASLQGRGTESGTDRGMESLTSMWRWLWKKSPKSDHECSYHRVIAPDLCEPYQPVYRCTVCGGLYYPCNR